MSIFRDRFVKLHTLPASELLKNPANFRTHPNDQRKALVGVLEEVGKTAVLTAFRNEAGQLELIDGHLRQDLDPAEQWQVAEYDLTREEANKVLATFDYLGTLAGVDKDVLSGLIQSITAESDSLR